MTSPPLTIRSLDVDELAMLHVWFAEPHLRPFYMRSDMTSDDVTLKFRPRCEPGHPTKVLIASNGGKPYGNCQWYLNRSYPDWAKTIATADGVSVDYFIGDPKYLGQGLAAPMLRLLPERAAPDVSTEDRDFFITHDNDNLIAQRATLAAGFVPLRSLVNIGKPSTLYMRRVE
jgi:RimJ/RimL family protein N-acetyltransferase